jgi:pyruvate dehydrogenase E2 component (dihydrolipoamide acetyltransferase)
MPNNIVMPRLGWTMESGRLVEWFKNEGDEVQAGELLFAVETDKAIQEVEALDTGVLHIPAESPFGEEAPVGAVLGYILAPGEAPPAGGSESTGAPEPVVPEVVEQAAPIKTIVLEGEPAISPRAKRVARELGVDWVVIAGSGSSGRIVERDVRAFAASAAVSPAPVNGKGRATPSVRRLAEERGVDLAVVAGSAPGGRITRSDVETVLSARLPDVAQAGDTVAPMSTVRRLTAQRMTEAARTVAPVTLTTEVDATELVAVRNRLKSENSELVPSITDLLVKLSALALAKHPELNSSIDGESIVQHTAINIGIAVDGERGLSAPVVRDATRKSLFAIAEESSDLIARARKGSLSPDAMTGGTFTISNLGMFGIDAFTPILNLPECAILGIGRIVAKPVVINDETDEVAVRRMLSLSLTFDHRIVDGAPAARFLQTLNGMIERPLTWLLR